MLWLSEASRKVDREPGVSRQSVSVKEVEKMKKLVLVVLILAIAGVGVLAAQQKVAPKMDGGSVMVPVEVEKSLVKLLNSRFSKAELASGTFVGTEFCRSCHGMSSFPGTNHYHALRQPMGMYSLVPGQGVMADYDANGVDDFKQGLDFNAITSALDATKPNAPILSYNAANDTYWIQLGPTGIKMQVVATWAGMSVGNGQRYMVRIPVTDTDTGYSRAIYFPPMSWGGTSWSSTSSTQANWYTGNTPKYAPGIASSALVPLQTQNYLATCSGCHITGVRKAYVTGAGEMVVNPYTASLVPENSPNYPDLDGDGIPDMANIGCESCHGPGSAHILGGGDPTKIVNPDALEASPGYEKANQAQAALCLQCHVQTGSFPTKKWGFTFDETNNRGFAVANPVPDLALYQASKAVKWPDGVAYSTERIDSFKSSDHYLGQFGHGIPCWDCHNVHSKRAEYMLRTSIRDEETGLRIPTSVENNSFCLACHATHGPFASLTKEQIAAFEENFEDIRNTVEAHANHPWGAERSMGLGNCVGCHMANNHTFWVSKPEDTIAFKDVVTSSTVKGNINSCSADCHRGKAIIWSDVPANLTYTDKLYNGDNEIKLANYLVKYFGPGGEWWDTGAAAKTAVKAEWK